MLSVRQNPEAILRGEENVASAFPPKESRDVLRRASVEQLISAMDQARVDRAVTFGFAWTDQTRCSENNRYVIESVQRYSKRLIGLCVVQPLSGNSAIEEVEMCMQEGCAGIHLKPSWQGYQLDDFSVTGKLFNYLESHDIPLLVHVTQAYKEPQGDHPHQVLAVAKAFPKLRILVEHLGGSLFLYYPHASAQTLMRNVFFITSVPRTPFMIRIASEILPKGRLVFGSDFPFNDSGDIAHSLKNVRESIHDAEKLEATLGAGELIDSLKRGRRHCDPV